MDRRSDDLDELLSDLSETLSELQESIDEESSSSGPRSRPPRRFLEFTEQRTIPALISLLETHIHALKLLQGVLRTLNGRSPITDNDRVQSTGRRTIDELNGVLDDIQGAIEGRPPQEASRELLDDARSLSSEIGDRLSDGAENGADTTTSEAISIDVSSPDEDDDDAALSVDDELDTIKRDLDQDERDNDDEE